MTSCQRRPIWYTSAIRSAVTTPEERNFVRSIRTRLREIGRATLSCITIHAIGPSRRFAASQYFGSYRSHSGLCSASTCMSMSRLMVIDARSERRRRSGPYLSVCAGRCGSLQDLIFERDTPGHFPAAISLRHRGLRRSLGGPYRHPFACVDVHPHRHLVPLDLGPLIRRNLLCHFDENHARNGHASRPANAMKKWVFIGTS